MFNTSQGARGSSCAADLLGRNREDDNTDGNCYAHVGLQKDIQGKFISLYDILQNLFLVGLLAFSVFSVLLFLLVINSTDAQFLLMH